MKSRKFIRQTLKRRKDLDAIDLSESNSDSDVTDSLEIYYKKRQKI